MSRNTDVQATIDKYKMNPDVSKAVYCILSTYALFGSNFSEKNLMALYNTPGVSDIILQEKYYSLTVNTIEYGHIKPPLLGMILDTTVPKLLEDEQKKLSKEQHNYDVFFLFKILKHPHVAGYILSMPAVIDYIKSHQDVLQRMRQLCYWKRYRPMPAYLIPSGVAVRRDPTQAGGSIPLRYSLGHQ